MSRGFSRNHGLEVARGNIAGMAAINKFGHAPSGIQTTITDVWDLADATPTQQIWVAPTQARTHQIVSSDAGDDGDPAGVGARTIKIWGLTGWGTAEVNETITMNGTTNVATANAYVIIHRMKVLTKGATDINVGTITATADTDGTVTAVILPGDGQTHMAIFGVPSIQTAYMSNFYATINKASGAVASIQYNIAMNPEPDAELLNFITSYPMDVQSTGGSHFNHRFGTPEVFPGPAIIKIQGMASAADIDGTAGFDLILIDN